MLTLSTYSGLDPRLKRIFDEISFKSINTKSLPFYFNVSGGKLGINTNAPRMPLDVVGDAWIDGRLQTTTLSVLGHLQALAGDFNGLVSTPDLGVTRRATLNNPEFYGAVKSDTLDFNLGTWRSYTPTYDGFSAAPTGVANYCRIGKLCIVQYTRTANGTSNETKFVVSAPFVSVNRTDFQSHGHCMGTDNGTNLATMGWVRILPNTSNFDLFKDASPAGSVWTSSGAKGAHFTISYEVA